jgi:hypothetical protein
MSATTGRRPLAILVLGPGRAGTSLTARLLNLAGVYLGPEPDLLTRTGIPVNPKGFWEHRGLSRINQRIFERLGGSWADPPPLPAGWEAAAELEGEREDGRALLEQAFGDRPLWGWKDSRNSLLLPFWRSLLPGGCEVRYVVCLRNPVDVAASLVPPRPLSKREAIDLWLLYVAGALVNTAGRSRLLVPYEAYFGDWRRAVGRLLAFAGLEAPDRGGEAEARMREFTDPALWRHRTAALDVIRDPEVRPEARSLHLIAELLAAAPEGDLADAVDAFALDTLRTVPR